MWILTFLTIFALLPFCHGEDQRGIVHVYGSSRIRVQLDCGSKFMNVHLFINGSSPFFDWIVVGKTNKPECRQQGNGDLQYLVEIPLLNDPCGTRMIEPSGTFENVISIKKMPLLILEGDETVSVQCVYGPPEIITPIIPTLPPSRNVQPSFLTTTAKSGEPLDDSNAIETTKMTAVLPAHIYLIIFMALFFTLLCLCCGCMYFFFKRRKLRFERRKKLLLAVPANSEMSKLALRHLWWSGKHGLAGGNGDGSGTVSNDALLTNDYMLSSNSTRGRLSVSTDYPSTTPPSSGGSSNASAGTINGIGQAGSNGTTEGHTHPAVYMHNDRGLVTMAQIEQRGINGRGPVGPSVASLRCIPEERSDYMLSNTGTNGRRQLYAAVDKKAKSQQTDSSETSPVGSNHGATLVSEFRSVSEVYSMFNHKEKDQQDDNADAASISTLEGRRYSPTREQIREATIVRADIHYIPSPPISAPPLPPAHSSSSTQTPSPPQFRLPSVSSPHFDIFTTAIENDPSQILTDRDVDRWRRLVKDDTELVRLLSDSKTMEDFESISRSSKYAREFSDEKWARIVQNLSQVTFVRRLSNIIDTQIEQQQQIRKPHDPLPTPPKPTQTLDPAQLNSSYNMGETLRDLQNGRQKRIFTRESYNHTKPTILSDPEFIDGKIKPTTSLFVVSREGSISTHNPSTINTALSQPLRDRSNSEVTELPPMLTVYMGHVESQRNLYGENFMQNAYSAVSDSDGSQEDKLPKSPTESMMEGASVYAAPSSSTIYGPDLSQMRDQKHF